MSTFIEKLEKIYESEKNLSNPPEYINKIKRVLEIEKDLKGVIK